MQVNLKYHGQAFNSLEEMLDPAHNVAYAALMPEYLELYVIIDLTSYFIFTLLALSMSFLWGYLGILSFGQTAFFGLGGYGYTVGKSIAYGYIPAAAADERDFEIEVMGAPVAATRHDGALYDPRRERILSCDPHGETGKTEADPQ